MTAWTDEAENLRLQATHPASPDLVDASLWLRVSWDATDYGPEGWKASRYMLDDDYPEASWQSGVLTTLHAQSSHGIPVLLADSGEILGPGSPGAPPEFATDAVCKSLIRAWQGARLK